MGKLWDELRFLKGKSLLEILQLVVALKLWVINYLLKSIAIKTPRDPVKHACVLV